MPNQFIIDVCDQIKKQGGLAYVSMPEKREYRSILNDPNECLVPLSEKVVRELSEGLSADAAVSHLLHQFFDKFNKMIEQIEAIKEEICGGYEEQIDPECEYYGPAATFGAKSGQDCPFAIRDGRWETGQPFAGYFVYFHPNWYHYEEVFKWEGNCLGQIGILPPKQIAESLMRLVELYEQDRIPEDYQDGAFQPLFDGDLNFTL